MTRLDARGAAPLALGALLLLPSCGPAAIATGSVPFPTRAPVLADGEGVPVRDLPPASEEARLVVLDPPWCSPCEGAWESVAAAVDSFPPGTVKVYRLLLDRERILQGRGEEEIAPARKPPPPGNVAVDTYHVLPRPFGETFEVERGPVFLLLDRRGKVRGKWTGFHPSLADDLAGGIRELAAPELTPALPAAPSPAPTPAPGR